MRLIRPIEEGSRLKPIKSVLNYIKLILYGMSDKYAQQYFSQVIDTNRMANGEAAKAAPRHPGPGGTDQRGEPRRYLGADDLAGGREREE